MVTTRPEPSDQTVPVRIEDEMRTSYDSLKGIVFALQSSSEGVAMRALHLAQLLDEAMGAG